MKKSGMASAELLARQGATVRATDLKSLEELGEAREVLGRLDIPFARQTAEVFEGCDLIVLSPDVPADLPALVEARRRGVRVIGEVELAAPFLKGETIGITGSNGKTTTTSLVGHILRRSRRAGAGGRQHRNTRDRHGGELARGWLERAGAFEFSARDHRGVSGAHRAGAERDRRTTSTATTRSRIMRPPRAGCLKHSGAETSPCSTPRTRCAWDTRTAPSHGAVVQQPARGVAGSEPVRRERWCWMAAC